jgi:RNA polymerase sigma-70 factor (ECF subfamily)
MVEVNGEPGMMNLDEEGKLINVIALEIADGQIQSINSVNNPEKLAHLGLPLSDLPSRFKGRRFGRVPD